ncbi:bacterio-opsin activator domain-containing protein [Natrialba sp. INN-245]|uniref:bacterio-opsin activator domain-containing protein n=1 Tax=Natrialba sp. INN-245 TaxID=2690967 RepID=UPI00131290F1|nr:bacterio-opsin activator domain-containing protein [Natrialba sp. INN-245]MWV38582.1 PAS domain-containing protein [Natrialba sp. INN-245]
MDDVESADDDGGDGGPTRAVLERIVDPVVAVVDGTVTYANRAAREAFGISDDGPEATALEGWDRLAEAVEETAAGTARHVDLEGRWTGARIHRDAEGVTIRFEPDGENEQEDDDRALKERAIAEAPVGAVISDPDRADNPLIYVNETFERITGYDFDEIVGQNCRFLQGEETDEDAIDELRAGIEERRPVTVELKNYRADGTEFWNEVTVAPLRNDRGELTHFVGFQNDVTARKKAEIELERRTEELEYVLDRIEGLVQDVTAAVAGSTTRSELEAEVCERIVAEAAYDGAWIGERNPTMGGVDVRASAGETSTHDRVTADRSAPEAMATESVSVETVDGHTHATFSLSYNEIEYGVITVRMAEDRPVDDRETVILSALARTLASGINARETSRILETDAIVAVELELVDDAIAPIAVSTEADCRLEYRRSTHRGDGTASLFTVTGADADDVRRAAESLDDVDCRIVVDRDDECLVEFVGEDDPVTRLSDRGARVRSIECRDGRAGFELEVPQSGNVRSVVEALEDRYDGTSVLSVRQREIGDTRQEFVERLEDNLTDRQFAVLRRAYLGGYFEWPRPVTGEELAQSMDVSRPTFHEHLRTAEQKLCQAVFDEQSG